MTDNLTIREILTAARNGVTKSRGASQRAKTFLDAGYMNRQYRDDALEELRQSVEQLIKVIEHLIGNEEDPKRRGDWPKYRMVINGEPKWLTIYNAGVAYDSGFYPVSIGGQVMDVDGEVRDITSSERTQIADIADDYSGGK